MSHRSPFSVMRTTERAETMSSKNFMNQLGRNLGEVYAKANAEKAAANRAFVLEMTRIEEEERRYSSAAATARAATAATAPPPERTSESAPVIAAPTLAPPEPAPEPPTLAPPEPAPTTTRPPLYAQVLVSRAALPRIRAPSSRRRGTTSKRLSSRAPPAASHPPGIAFTYRKRKVPAFSIKKGGRKTRRVRH